MDNPLADTPPNGETNLNGLPPNARRALRKLLVIPLEFRSQLLPDPSMSLFDLADFKIPTQMKTPCSNAMFLTDEEPSPVSDDMLKKLRYLSIPDTDTIRRLVDSAQNSCANGARSLHYSHLATQGSTKTAELHELKMQMLRLRKLLGLRMRRRKDEDTERRSLQRRLVESVRGKDLVDCFHTTRSKLTLYCWMCYFWGEKRKFEPFLGLFWQVFNDRHDIWQNAQVFSSEAAMTSDWTLGRNSTVVRMYHPPTKAMRDARKFVRLFQYHALSCLIYYDTNISYKQWMYLAKRRGEVKLISSTI